MGKSNPPGWITLSMGQQKALIPSQNNFSVIIYYFYG